MSHEFNSGVNEIRISCVTTDKKLGTIWAIGTHNQWMEIRTTKAGKIKPYAVKKGKHPYFTVSRGAL